MDKKQKKLLVIGGTGFIGSHLCKNAIKKNYKVYSISMNLPKTYNKISTVKYYRCNILDTKKLKKILSNNFDYVVNLGGYIDHSSYNLNGKNIFDQHFFGLVNLINFLKRDKLKKFIHIGSSDEYGISKYPQNEKMKEKPFSAYSSAKVSSTRLLKSLYNSDNFPVVIIRLFLVYGPFQKDNRFLPFIIKSCLANKTFETTSGSQIRDFCYVDDVIEAIFILLKSKKSNGEIFNVGSGKPIKIKNVIEYVVKIIGKGVPQFGKIKMRKNENTSLYSNNYKIYQKTIWKPKINIKSGLIKTIDFYKNL
tara:strand:- start:2959 stop:3879 length:921 start_codon:yes stop_codon:yes gene_type:complete